MEYVEFLKALVLSGFVAIPVLTYGIVQAVKMMGKIPKWALPILSFGIGAIVGGVVSFFMKDMPVYAGAIVGMVIAGFTSSVYDAFRGVQKVKEKNMIIESGQLNHYADEQSTRQGDRDE